MPSISVVIPTYNTAGLLRQAIDSALAQTLPSAEIIVIDDGSIDDTSDVVASYGDRVRYVQQANAGVSAARNRGLRLASSEFVAFLDSDDVWHPRKLELQAAPLAADAGLGMLGTFMFDWPLAAMPNVTDEPLAAPLEEISWERLVVKNHFVTSSVMIRASILAEVGTFDPALKSTEDRDLWLRIAERSRVANVPLPLTGNRPLAGSLSRKAFPVQENMLRMLAKVDAANGWKGRPRLRRKAYCLTYLSCAYVHHSAGNHFTALKDVMISYVWYPLPLSPPEVRTRWARPKSLLTYLLRMLRLKSPEPPPSSRPVVTTAATID